MSKLYDVIVVGANPPEDQTLYVNLRTSPDGDAEIVVNGVAVAFVDISGKLYRYTFEERAESMRAAGIPVNDDGAWEVI